MLKAYQWYLLTMFNRAYRVFWLGVIVVLLDLGLGLYAFKVWYFMLLNGWY